ncbi:hypothetical protein P7C70_g316, partial [Phenoliferia sp. Uapishka_3]
MGLPPTSSQTKSLTNLTLFAYLCRPHTMSRNPHAIPGAHLGEAFQDSTNSTPQTQAATSSAFLTPTPPYYYRSDPQVRPRLYLSDATGGSPVQGTSYHLAGQIQHPYAHEPPSTANSWPGDLGGVGRSPMASWSAGPSSDVFYDSQQDVLPSSGPIRRSHSLTSGTHSTSTTIINPRSPESSSRDELSAQLAQQAQHDKKRRSAESSQRHREKRRQLEREKDARLEFLERKVYQLESELKRAGGSPGNFQPISEATESLVASLRQENYELRQALQMKSEADGSESNLKDNASGSSESPSISPAPSQLGHHQTSEAPLRPPNSSFSALARQRLSLAPQLLLRSPESERYEDVMDTGEYAPRFASTSHGPQPPTPNSAGQSGSV